MDNKYNNYFSVKNNNTDSNKDTEKNDSSNNNTEKKDSSNNNTEKKDSNNNNRDEEKNEKNSTSSNANNSNDDSIIIKKSDTVENGEVTANLNMQANVNIPINVEVNHNLDATVKSQIETETNIKLNAKSVINEKEFIKNYSNNGASPDGVKTIESGAPDTISKPTDGQIVSPNGDNEEDMLEGDASEPLEDIPQVEPVQDEEESDGEEQEENAFSKDSGGDEQSFNSNSPNNQRNNNRHKNNNQQNNQRGNNQQNNNPLNNNGNRNAPGNNNGQKNGNRPAQKQSGANKSLNNNAKKNDNPKKNPASQKLKNSKFNKAKNLMGNLFNKKKDDSSDSGSDDSEEKDAAAELAETIKKIKRVLMIIKALLPIIFYVLLIVLIVALISAIIGAIFPFLKTGGDVSGSDNEEIEEATLYEEDDPQLEKYQKYIEKVEEVVNGYNDRCDDDISANYINSIAMYKYTSGNYEDFNYDEMIDIMDEVKNQIPADKCGITYDADSDFYQNIRGSSKIVNYYSELFTDTENIDTILAKIFEFGGEIEAELKENNNADFISSDAVVSQNNGDTINMKDYLAGVIYANVPSNELTNVEKVKAYTVLYTTNTIANNNLSVSSQKITISDAKGDVYCDINSDCNGKGAISDIQKNTITNAINSVYGEVLIDKSGKYKPIDVSSLSSGNNYKEILADTYSNYSVKEIKEDSYANGVNFGSEKVLTSVYFYDQNDYANVSFCGRSNGTIKTSGCGTTAMSMIVSTYENDDKYNPVEIMNRAHKLGYCGKGISGTGTGFFYKEAKAMGYKYLKVGKSKKSDLNLLTYHLRKGHLAIVHVGAGHFTSGGHYMVLGGIDPTTKKVYVYDPYNKVNKKYRKTGNGWYSLNDIIAKEAKNFYIIWKG